MSTMMNQIIKFYRLLKTSNDIIKKTQTSGKVWVQAYQCSTRSSLNWKTRQRLPSANSSQLVNPNCHLEQQHRLYKEMFQSIKSKRNMRRRIRIKPLKSKSLRLSSWSLIKKWKPLKHLKISYSLWEEDAMTWRTICWSASRSRLLRKVATLTFLAK